MAAQSSTSGLLNGSSSLHCFERAYWGRQAKVPVTLVAFDFDETLTTVSVFPTHPDFERRIGFRLTEECTDWCYETHHASAGMDYREASHAGGRVSKLHTMLRCIQGDTEKKRILAVITRNPCGPVACLNSLMQAGLADFFTVILGMQDIKGLPQGVYRDESTWKTFHPPVMKFDDHKADVLSRIVDDPSQWFPTLVAAGADADVAVLRGLKLANVLLVDDDEDNFQSASSKVLRCCKVGTYAAHHPKLGFQEKMGGIGASSDDDYSILVEFVEEPWRFPWHLRGGDAGESKAAPPRRGGEVLERRSITDSEIRARFERPMVSASSANSWPEPHLAANTGATNCSGYVATGFAAGYMLMSLPAVSMQSFPVSTDGPSNLNCNSGPRIY